MSVASRSTLRLHRNLNRVVSFAPARHPRHSSATAINTSIATEATIPTPTDPSIATAAARATRESNALVSKGCLGEIVRHGAGDACITLNVGGKEFTTLRSTINANAVLAEHVARAEYNPTITTGPVAHKIAFIDRDPDHFAFILRHLRNRAEQSTAGHYEKSSRLNKQKSTASVYVDLPTDPNILGEIYVEAVYYRIPELQNALRNHGVTAHVSHLLKKQWNPFDFITKLLLQIRVGALAAGTVGGTWFMSAQHDWDTTLRKWGWKS